MTPAALPMPDGISAAAATIWRAKLAHLAQRDIAIDCSTLFLSYCEIEARLIAARKAPEGATLEWIRLHREYAESFLDHPTQVERDERRIVHTHGGYDALLASKVDVDMRVDVARSTAEGPSVELLAEQRAFAEAFGDVLRKDAQ